MFPVLVKVGVKTYRTVDSRVGHQTAVDEQTYCKEISEEQPQTVSKQLPLESAFIEKSRRGAATL